METLFLPDWAPNMHPMLVHFPIAILAIAILFDFLSFFLPKERKWWTVESTALLYGVGAATAIGVYFTGKEAVDSVFLPAAAQSVLTTHADWAFYVVWFYGIYAVLRIIATWKGREENRMKFHVGFFALSFVGLFLLVQTGDNGAKLVFKYGAGVQTNKTETPVKLSQETDSEGLIDNSTTFITTENGNWEWEMGKNAISDLRNNFHWLIGSLENANAEAVIASNGRYVLSFSGGNLNDFFVSHDSFNNTQIDYYLDMSTFEGVVMLTNNVVDESNFDFVSISSGGEVIQGRLVNGKETIFEKGSNDTSKPMFVRVVSSGTHFRGYIDKKMVVHGHGDAPKDGAVGLKIKGSGKILLEKMSLSKL